MVLMHSRPMAGVDLNSVIGMVKEHGISLTFHWMKVGKLTHHHLRFFFWGGGDCRHAWFWTVTSRASVQH